MRNFTLFSKVVLLGATVCSFSMLQSCGKSSGNKLIGTWVVRSATADTSIHSEPGLDAVVTAGNLAEGATLTFATDSLTFTVPPDMIAHSRPYSVLASGNQVAIQHRNGSKDTMEFAISMDTILELNRPSRHIKMRLARSSM